MFLWYTKRQGKWYPVRSIHRPSHIFPHERKTLSPISEFGLGYYLDMHERRQDLDELVRKYPPPQEEETA